MILKSVNAVQRAICWRLALVVASAALVGGCASYPSWIPSSGPNLAQITEAPKTQADSNIRIFDINDAVAQRLIANRKPSRLSDAFGQSTILSQLVGAGDVIEVSIWEAPPAALFGSSTAILARVGPSTTHATTFPEQMVGVTGFINIPFAGNIRAAGRTLEQIETEVANKLKGKANQPQVLARVIRNNTANVTVVGEVATSLRMPLTAKGERLLDALAAAGGVRQSINKMTLQVARGGKLQSMPLEAIIRDPLQNILLQPGDVITSVFQPLSFTVLGATGKNEEVNFEAQGISLAQALARAGGLQDARADAQGVFLFRFESPSALPEDKDSPTTPDGRVPVVYRLDLKDPTSFFVAQNFVMQNQDVLYVSNAPAAELQKFLNILSSTIYSIYTVKNGFN